MAGISGCKVGWNFGSSKLTFIVLFMSLQLHDKGMAHGDFGGAVGGLPHDPLSPTRREPMDIIKAVEKVLKMLPLAKNNGTKLISDVEKCLKTLAVSHSPHPLSDCSCVGTNEEQHFYCGSKVWGYLDKVTGSGSIFPDPLKVMYYKIRGDHFLSLAEICKQDYVQTLAANKSQIAYEEALDTALRDPRTKILIIEISFDYSNLLNDILGHTHEAIRVAKIGLDVEQSIGRGRGLFQLPKGVQVILKKLKENLEKWENKTGI